MTMEIKNLKGAEMSIESDNLIGQVLLEVGYIPQRSWPRREQSSKAFRKRIWLRY